MDLEGRIILSFSDDKSLKILLLKSGVVVKILRSNKYFKKPVLTPEGKYAAFGIDNKIFLWNLK